MNLYPAQPHALISNGATTGGRGIRTLLTFLLTPSTVDRIFIDPLPIRAQVLFFNSFIENSITYFTINFSVSIIHQIERFEIRNSHKFPGDGLTEHPSPYPSPACSLASPSIWAPPTNLWRFASSIKVSPDSDDQIPQLLTRWLRPC